MFPTKVRIPLILILPALLGGCTTGHHDFGQPLAMAETDTVALATILADKPAYDGKSLRVSGTISAVCENRGCWLRMVDGVGGEDVFVKFTCPVKGRLIPMKAVNHRVVVEGKIVMGEMSEEMARHYAKDGGASEEEIAKIVGPQPQISIQAPAARVYGI
jgi:hypothetical protein